MTRAFFGDSVGHALGIGRIELRNRSNPVRSIAPGADVTLSIDTDEIALVPAAN